MAEERMKAQIKKRRLKAWGLLGLLLLACLVPIVLANWAYRHNRDLNVQVKHHGRFVKPVDVGQVMGIVQGKSQALSHWRDRWLLVYDDNQCCDKICYRQLRQLHKMRIALHGGWERTRIIALQPSQCQVPTWTGHEVIVMQQSRLRRKLWTKALPMQHQKRRVVIIDPHSIAVMTYKLSKTPRPIYEDMRVLLRTSQIG